MRDEIMVLHLYHLKGVPKADKCWPKAEIIPKEPGQVMLPREAMIAIRCKRCQKLKFRQQKSIGTLE
ncbi:hypothetical protein Q2T41_07850 [Maribacter confluentis]|uniref:Uncharacterized protein n=1 Tax=Maribacter confluentis TaxID=1656093 RepID=A0ABT8RP17_9FLAO|nr:hypothetical protein [Maribacter confluentis]MDO1512565.1 hypothetical protein [Maribacter confluentis]